MSQAMLVARVAVRELWMTFRLLIVLAAFSGAAAIVVLLPAGAVATMDRLALGLGLATVVVAAVAAWTMASERAGGRAGWLVTRSLSRGTYLVGWIIGLAAVTVVGVIAAGLLGWLAASGLAISLDAPAYLAVVLAVAITAVAAVTLGLTVGALLPSAPAAVLSAALCAASGGLVLVASGGSAAVPGAAYLLFSRLVGAGSVMPDAMRAAGVGLLQIAVLFVIARAAMERAEL